LEIQKVEKGSEEEIELLEKRASLLQETHATSLAWWEVEKEKLGVMQEQLEVSQQLREQAMEIAKADLVRYQKEIENSLNAQIVSIEKESDEIDEQLDALKAKKDLADDELKTRELMLAVEEARLKLYNVNKERDTRILTDQGWTYVANPKNVRDAQESLKSAEKTYAEWLEELRFKTEVQKLEDKKAIMKQEVDAIKEQLTIIKDLENASFSERLEGLQKFVSTWNSKVSEMQYGQSISPTEVSAKTGSTGKSLIEIMQDNSKKWSGASATEKKVLEEQNEDIGNLLGLEKNPSAGTWHTTSGKKAFAKGGVNDYTGDAMLHGTKTRPELILNNQQAGFLYKMLQQGSNNFGKTKQAQDAKSGMSLSIGNITLPNVSDGDSFVRDLRLLARVR